MLLPDPSSVAEVACSVAEVACSVAEVACSVAEVACSVARSVVATGITSSCWLQVAKNSKFPRLLFLLVHITAKKESLSNVVRYCSSPQNFLPGCGTV